MTNDQLSTTNYQLPTTNYQKNYSSNPRLRTMYKIKLSETVTSPAGLQNRA